MREFMQFGGLACPRRRAICLGTNLDAESTRLTIVSCVLHPSSGRNNLFWGPKCCTFSLEKHPFCILFQVPPSCGVFDSYILRWAASPAPLPWCLPVHIGQNFCARIIGFPLSVGLQMLNIRLVPPSSESNHLGHGLPALLVSNSWLRLHPMAGSVASLVDLDTVACPARVNWFPGMRRLVPRLPCTPQPFVMLPRNGPRVHPPQGRGAGFASFQYSAEH